jgi:hypothetical protein
MYLFARLWDDDCGGVLAAEWLFLATLLVLGTVGGLVAVRQAVISEFTEYAQAVMALNQGYSFSGQSNAASATPGSYATDATNAIALSAMAGGGGAVINQTPAD